MIATGSEFIFIKLVKGGTPQYATSAIFSMRNPGNDLYDVLKIFKKLIEIASAWTSTLCPLETFFEGNEGGCVNWSFDD